MMSFFRILVIFSTTFFLEVFLFAQDDCFEISFPKMYETVRGVINVRIPKKVVPADSFVTFFKDDTFLVSSKPTVNKSYLEYKIDTIALNIPDGLLKLKARLTKTCCKECKCITYKTFSRVYLNIDNHTSIEKVISKSGVNFKKIFTNLDYEIDDKGFSDLATLDKPTLTLRNYYSEKDKMVSEVLLAHSKILKLSPLNIHVKRYFNGKLLDFQPTSKLWSVGNPKVNQLPRAIGKMADTHLIFPLPIGVLPRKPISLGDEIKIALDEYSGLYISKDLTTMISKNLEVSLNPVQCGWIKNKRCLEVLFELMGGIDMNYRGSYWIDVDTGVIIRMNVTYANSIDSEDNNQSHDPDNTKVEVDQVEKTLNFTLKI